MANQQLNAVIPPVTGAIRDRRKLHLIEGIILVLSGVLAVFMPLWVEAMLFGWLFLVGGIAGLVTTVMLRHAPGFWWSLLSAILTIVFSGMLVAQPILAMVTLTVLLIGFFFLEGIVTIMFALEHQRELSGRWSWMLVSGIVDLSLASVIVLGLPATSAWAIGLIVGTNLISGGAAMIGMALSARPSIDGESVR